MKKWLTFLLIFVLAFVLYGCKDDPIPNGDDVLPTEISISGAKASLEIGQTVKLTAKVNPTGADQGVLWSSSGDAVATVDQTGKVVAVSEGTVVITATSKKTSTIKQQVTIKIVKAAVVVEPTEVEITENPASLEVGNFAQLSVVVKPQGADQGVQWSSSDNAIATVDQTGKVVAVGEGTVVITATSKKNTEIKKTVTIIIEESETGIKIAGNPASLEIGKTAQLTATDLPEGVTEEDVFWTVDSEDVATINEETGLVTAVAEGEVVVTATLLSDNTISKSVTITVVPAAIIYEDPTGVEFTSTFTEVAEKYSVLLKFLVLPEKDAEAGTPGAEQKVIWESSDPSIAEVDASGRVTGIVPGIVTIKITVLANEELTAELEFEVKEEEPDVVIDPPQSIEIQGEHEVEEGMQIILTASVLPEGVPQSVVWTSSDPSIATVNAQGIVSGLTAGEVFIVATSTVDDKVSSAHEVIVNLLAPYPDANDLGGYNIILFAAPHAVHEHDPFLEKYTSNDKASKQAAWEATEIRWNAKLKVEGFPESAGWGDPRKNYIIDNANIGKAEMDLFVSTTDWVKDFGDANAAVDVLDFYEEFGKNSIDPGTRAASTYKGGLYSLPSSSVGSIKAYHGLAFNVNKLNSLGLDNPSAKFNNDEWTWSDFEAYVIDAASKLGEGESVLSGKPAGLFYGMVSAAGVRLIDSSKLQINFAHPYARNAAKLIRDLYLVEGMWGDNAWDAQNPSFNTQKSIFQVAEYWFLKDDGRFGKEMWGEDTRFGFVPFPYHDDVAKEDTRVSYQGGAIYQMAAGREYPTGVTAEDVYRVFTEMMLETTRNMLADTTVDEEYLMRRAAERKIDDPESVTAIVYFKSDKVIYDPFFSILPSWSASGPMIDEVVVNGGDYMQVTKAREPEFRAALLELFG